MSKLDADLQVAPLQVKFANLVFFQEQIVGLFGPAVHVNNIIRTVGQATGLGTFDPRSWPSIARVILSPKLRERMQQGVDDATIDLLVKRGAYTDWSDIGNLNRYIGGNLNPLNWIRAFGAGVRIFPPVSVTATISSMRIPNFPSI